VHQGRKLEERLTLHDVVTVGNETDRDGQGEDGELPDGDRGLGRSGSTSGPGRVDDSPWSDGVSDIIGTVGEGCGTGGENLDEGVGVLDIVGVLGGVVVDALHAVTLRGAFDTRLGGVDVVVETVEGTDDNHGRNTLGDDDHVVQLVGSAGAGWVVTEGAHSPAQRTALLEKLSM
jgi:hypothetical protein